MGSKLVVRSRWRKVRVTAVKLLRLFRRGIEVPLRESGMRAGVPIGPKAASERH